MKRHLNTSYRLVWNHITGTLVVASELARSRGKRAGVAVALSLAAVTSVPALAADTVVPVPYKHLLAHETEGYSVCALLLEKKKTH
ncbi:ESPR domain-containing protein, partial [Escherichia coli]|uniref:ESPR domain-containing protein n=1 Tax=Escherichia coli TaxID=562 RepID=UPI000A8051D9